MAAAKPTATSATTLAATAAKPRLKRTNPGDSAPRPKREAMSRVDTAWLRMERPTNPMMITGVLMFADAMSLQQLKKVIQQRFLSYARFRQKPVDSATGAQWLDDTDFDLDWHVRLSGLPGRPGKASEKRALERFVSNLASSPLDPTKPLWQFHLVERYQGGCAVVARIHHCYADGIALVQVLLSLTDTSRAPVASARLDKAWLKHEAAPVARRVGAMDRYMKLGGKMLGQGMAMMQDPSLASLLAKEGGDIAKELVHALALPDDPPSLLRGRLGVSKRVAWAEPLNLEEVKAVGRACGCTVNDVLMAARHRAGQLAPVGARQKIRQPLWSGVFRAAGGRGQSAAQAGARCRLHEPTQTIAASHRCLWPAGRAGDRPATAARIGAGDVQPQSQRSGHQCAGAAAGLVYGGLRIA